MADIDLIARKRHSDFLKKIKKINDEIKQTFNTDDYIAISNQNINKLNLIDAVSQKNDTDTVIKLLDNYKKTLEQTFQNKNEASYKKTAEKLLELYTNLNDLFFDTDYSVSIPDEIQKSTDAEIQSTFFIEVSKVADSITKLPNYNVSSQIIKLTNIDIKSDNIQTCVKNIAEKQRTGEYIFAVNKFCVSMEQLASHLKQEIDEYTKIIKNIFTAEDNIKNIQIEGLYNSFAELFIDILKNTAIKVRKMPSNEANIVVDEILKDIDTNYDKIKKEFIENGPVSMLDNGSNTLSKIAAKHKIYPFYIGTLNDKYGKSVYEGLQDLTTRYNKIRTNLYDLTGEILSNKNKIKELNVNLKMSNRKLYKMVKEEEIADLVNQEVEELRKIFGNLVSDDQLKEIAQKELKWKNKKFHEAKNNFNEKLLNLKYVIAHGKKDLAVKATKSFASGAWSFAKNVFEGRGYDLNELGKSLIKSSIKTIARGVKWSAKTAAYSTGRFKTPEMKKKIDDWKSTLAEEYKSQQKKEKLLKKYGDILDEQVEKSSRPDKINELFEDSEKIFKTLKSESQGTALVPIDDKVKKIRDKKEAIQALSAPVPNMDGVSSDNENMEIIAAGVEAATGLATTSFDIAANTYAEKDMSAADSAINNEIRLNSRNITRIASNIKDMIKNIKNKSSNGILSIFSKKSEAVKSKEIEPDKKTSWWDKIKGILGGLALLMGVPFSFLKKALGVVFDIGKLLLKGGFIFGKWLIKTIFASGLVKFIGEEIIKAIKSTTLGKWIFNTIDAVKNSVAWVKEQFFKLRDSVKSIGKFIKDLSTPLFKILPKAAVEMLKGGLTKITDSVSGLFSADEVKNSKVIKIEGPQQSVSIYQRFKNTMSKATSAVGNFFTGIYNAIANFVSKLASAAYNQIKNIFPDFAKNAESFLSSLKNNLKEIVKTIKSTSEKIHEFLSNTVEFAKKNINEITNTVKGWVDNIASIVSKPGKALAWAKKAIKIVMKVLFNVGKILVKGIVKTVAKAIPGVGLIASCAFAYDYWEKGQYVRAILTLASGIAYCIPVFGTTVGLILDAGIIGYEIGEFIAEDFNKLKENPQNTEAMSNVVNAIGNASNETHDALFNQEFQTNVINSIKSEPGSSKWGNNEDNNWEFDLSSLVENDTSSAFEVNTASEDFFNAGTFNDSNVFNINLAKQDANNQPNRDFYNNQIEINKEEVEKIKETNGSMIDQVKNGMQQYFEAVKHYRYNIGAKGVNGIAEMDCSAFVFNSLQAATNGIENGDRIRNLLGIEDKDRNFTNSTSLFNKLAKTGASTFKTTFAELNTSDLRDGDVIYEFVPGTDDRHIVYVRDGLVYESSSGKLNGKSGVKARPMEQFLKEAKGGKRRSRIVLKVNSYQALTLAAEAAERGEGLSGPKITATSDVSLLGSNLNFSNKFDTSEDLLPNISELLNKFNPTKIKSLISEVVSNAESGFEKAKNLLTNQIKRLNTGDLHNNFDQLMNDSSKITSNNKLKRETTIKQAAAEAVTIASNLYQQMVYFKKYRFILNSKIDDVIIGKLKASK